jgi:hypothetical protein
VAARVDLTVGEDVRLPVVELQAGGVADLLARALRVLDVGQADGDLARAGALDLGLRDAERVDPLAHRLDRVVDRLRRDLRDLRRRLALVDELDAALEVEPELGVLRERRPRDDHQQRQHEQRGDDAQDRQVAGTACHRGVSTSRSPPSSS